MTETSPKLPREYVLDILPRVLGWPEAVQPVMEAIERNPLLIAALRKTGNPRVVAAMLRNEMLLKVIELTGLPNFPPEVVEGLLRDPLVLEELKKTIDPDILAAMTQNPAIAGIELQRRLSDLGMATFEQEEVPGGLTINEGVFGGGASDNAVDNYLEEQNSRFLRIVTAIIDDPELRARVLNLNNYQLGLIELMKEIEFQLLDAKKEASNLRRDLDNRNNDFTRISTSEENARRTSAIICEEFDSEKNKTKFWKRATTALATTFGLFIGGAFLWKEWSNKPDIEIVNKQEIYKQSSKEYVVVKNERYREEVSVRVVMEGPESAKLLVKLKLPDGSEARTFYHISIDTHLNRFSFKTDTGVINRNFEPMGVPYPDYLAKVIGWELTRENSDFSKFFPDLYETAGIPQAKGLNLRSPEYDNEYKKLILEEIIYRDIKRGLKNNSFLPKLGLVILGKGIIDICQTDEDKEKVRGHFIEITNLITKEKEPNYLRIASELEKAGEVFHKAQEILKKEKADLKEPKITRVIPTSDADGFFIEGTLPRSVHENEVQNTGQRYPVSEEQLRARLPNHEIIKIELSGFIRACRDLALGREMAPLSR